MAKVITGPNALEAWRNAVRHLIAHHGEDFNLVVEIQDGTAFDESWLVNYSPCRIRPSLLSAKQVADTIFPEKIQRFSVDQRDFYRRYQRAQHLMRVMRRHFPRQGTSWGTYFERLIRFGETEHPKNQLKDVIHKMRTWKNHKAAYVFHLSSPETDKIQHMAGPCWHFGELTHQGNNIYDLVAVYRNHDYFSKALGNFVGLGKLLEFVCTEAGKRPGRLICHSVHAYFDSTHPNMRSLARL